MKARIKATGEIVDVTRIGEKYVVTHHPHTITFEKDELDFNIADDPDYWARLEHQAAIAAMQGMLAGTYYQGLSHDRVVEDAQYVAHALVEELKKSNI